MPAAQQGNQSDNSNGILWGTAAIFATIGIIWYAFSTQIILFYLYVKRFEILFLRHFTHRYDDLLIQVTNAISNPKQVSFNGLIEFGHGVGDTLRYPLAALMFVLGFIIYFSNTANEYRRAYSMKDLAELEKDNWPQINPVVGVDLLNVDIDKGAWAMAMTPMQFCKRFRLLEEVQAQRFEGMSRRDWARKEVVLKRGEANKLFSLQLGQLWKDVNHLAPHTRALFAAFMARFAGDTKGGVDLLLQLNQSAGKKINLDAVNLLIKKHINSPVVQEVLARHAYVLTVMASMLEGAREDGVQASSDFLWLKPLDRRLWYTLNTVGRQTPFIEVAGVFAHWIAEKEANNRLFIPAIDEATKALELALTEVVYRPDE